MGLEIVDTEAFATGDKDFKAQMTNIASKNPDIVFCPIYYGEAGLAIQAARQAGCTATFLGGDGFGSVKDYASAEELEGSVYCSGYAPGTEDVAQFEKDYCETFGVEEVPNMFAPLAYDASMIMAYGLKAAEDAGLEAGTDEYKQAVIDAIKTMDGVKGITGYLFLRLRQQPHQVRCDHRADRRRGSLQRNVLSFDPARFFERGAQAPLPKAVFRTSDGCSYI